MIYRRKGQNILKHRIKLSRNDWQKFDIGGYSANSEGRLRLRKLLRPWLEDNIGVEHATWRVIKGGEDILIFFKEKEQTMMFKLVWA